jgi:N6-L-threonylcarbamoyladenine synthase
MSASAPDPSVLGIETSCDETAAAVVGADRRILSSVVASQVDLHARFGGVVPELAGRAHLELLTPVVAEALERADALGRPPVGAVAVTCGPGLVGSLLVGLSQAKALAMAWDVPFVGVNHLEGHLFASLLDHPDLEWPLVVLLVSGGHTVLVLVEGVGRYRLLGQTLDDAAGEAFDKVARYLGLGYPGGPAVDREAVHGDPGAFSFPRALLDDGYDFSFSGLKTAVVRTVDKTPDAPTADVAASFQEAVVDVLVTKARRAMAATGAKGLCLAGGVAANSLLRRRAEEACRADGVAALVPSLAMCTDNAAMVAAAGQWRLAHDGPSPLSLGADPNLFLSFTGQSSSDH